MDVAEVLSHDNVIQALPVDAFQRLNRRLVGDIGRGQFVLDISPLPDAGDVVELIDDLRIGLFQPHPVRPEKLISKKVGIGNDLGWNAASGGLDYGIKHFFPISFIFKLINIEQDPATHKELCIFRRQFFNF